MRPVQWALLVIAAVVALTWCVGMTGRENGNDVRLRDYSALADVAPAGSRSEIPRRPPLKTCTLWAEPSFYVCSNGTGWNRQDGGWAFAGYQSGGPIVPQR